MTRKFFRPCALALAAATALSAHATQVSGTLKNAYTGEAVDLEYDAGVQLYRCDATGVLCDTFVAGMGGNVDGTYVLDIPGDAAGTYRLRALAPFPFPGHAHTQFGQGQSEAFVIKSTDGNIARDLVMAPPHPDFIDVTPCATALPGANCTFSYTVSNPTAVPVSVSVWAEVDLREPTPQHYTLGLNDKKRSPIAVDLPAHGSRRITQQFTIPADMPLGSLGSVSLAASDKGRPTMAAVNVEPNFLFRVGADATPSRPVADAPHDAPGAHALPPPTPISGHVVDAVTGAPFAAGTMVTLLQCDTAEIAVCTQFPSHFSEERTAKDGSYSIRYPFIPAGRFQVSAETNQRTAYSPIFEYAGHAVKNVDVPVTHWFAKLTNVTACPATLHVGASCTVSADLENDTDQDATFDVTATVDAYQLGSAVYFGGDFDVGADAKGAPLAVAVPAGQTRRVSIALKPLRALPVDGGAKVTLGASVHDLPLAAAAARVDAGTLKIVP